MPSAKFDSMIKKYAVAVEKSIVKIVNEGEQIQNLHDGLSYALALDLPLEKRGKRIRPVLCLLTCEALGGKISRAMPFAVAIEVMHNFFLIHDDIEDGDTYRRDRPCTHIKYGLETGINIGDYMFTKVFKALMMKTNPPLSDDKRLALIDLAVDTLDHTHIGQALDINARTSRNFTEKDYMKLVTEKTGYYLAAPIIGGAIVAGADKATIKALQNYGKCIGPLFQIVDDMIDLTSGKGRKEIGSDIKEGKRSFLVAYAADKISEKDRKKLFNILDKSREQTTAKDVSWAISLFEKSGAIEAGRKKGEQLLADSRKALKNICPRLRESLEFMADKMLNRNK